MRLYEVAIAGDRMYKGQPANPEKMPANAFDIRTQELEKNIEGWKELYDKLPDKDAPYAMQVKFRIEDMKQELADFNEIGELPFTFYAARNREDAEYFQAQFPDGVIDEVKLYAKNLATVDDLRKIGFPMKHTVSHLTPMMIHKLKQAGFDGATGPIDNVQGGEEVVVFSPEQVKRV